MREVHLIWAGIRSRSGPHGRQRTRWRQANSSETLSQKSGLLWCRSSTNARSRRRRHSSTAPPFSPDAVASGLPTLRMLAERVGT